MYYKKHMLLTLLFTICEGIFRNHTSWNHIPRDCGTTRYDNTRTRIVGGTKANLGQFPWMVKLGIKRGGRDTFFICGGTLVTRFYVVSAAHCEEVANIIRVGESNTDTPIDCDEQKLCAPPHQDIPILNYKFTDYCRTISMNDIMLIELEKPVVFNEFVRPICLPRHPISMLDLEHSHVILAGWGAVDGSASMASKVLMYITAPVLDFNTCRYSFSTMLKHSQICVGTSEDGGNPCYGDSGGPAVKAIRLEKKHRMYLVGIASYVQANCQGGAVYTNVLYYMDFILNGIEKS